MGRKLGHFGVILDHFLVDPESFWGHLGIILASFWHHVGLVLVSFWPHFGLLWTILDPFWALFFAHYRAIFGAFLPPFRCFKGHSAVFLVVFWEGDCKIKRNDAREGKLCKFLPKLTQMMQNCATASPFSAVKHLFRLKTGQNRRFNLWKYAVSGCVWKCPEWILSVFMHFYEGPHYFWPFWPFWSHFWPYPGLYRAFLGRNFWCRFSVVLTPFWALLGPFLSRFWTPFWTVFARLRVFGMFWEANCKIKHNDARKGTIVQLSAKMHQNYTKLCKNRWVFFDIVKPL